MPAVSVRINPGFSRCGKSVQHETSVRARLERLGRASIASEACAGPPARAVFACGGEEVVPLAALRNWALAPVPLHTKIAITVPPS